MWNFINSKYLTANTETTKFIWFDRSVWKSKPSKSILTLLSFKGCPPYMVAHFGHDFDNPEFYLIPPAMAYYAATHQGWTRKGRENARLRSRQKLQSELQSLLGVNFYESAQVHKNIETTKYVDEPIGPKFT